MICNLWEELLVDAFPLLEGCIYWIEFINEEIIFNAYLISFALGYELNKALRAINRVDVITHCKYNEEEVTDELEKAVALSQLEPAGFDDLKEELGPSRDASMARGLSLDVSYDEKDLVKVLFIDILLFQLLGWICVGLCMHLYDRVRINRLILVNFRSKQ